MKSLVPRTAVVAVKKLAPEDMAVIQGLDKAIGEARMSLELATKAHLEAMEKLMMAADKKFEEHSKDTAKVLAPAIVDGYLVVTFG